MRMITSDDRRLTIASGAMCGEQRLGVDLEGVVGFCRDVTARNNMCDAIYMAEKKAARLKCTSRISFPQDCTHASA